MDLLILLGGSAAFSLLYGLAGLIDAVGDASPAFTGQPDREASFLLNEGGPVASRLVFGRMRDAA